MAPEPLNKSIIYAQPIAETSLLVAGLSKYPTTPGQHVIILKIENLFDATKQEFEEIMQFARHYAGLVQQSSAVRRCGFAYDGFQNIHIIPMHGLSEDWSPMVASDTPFDPTYSGFLWTKSSPHLSREQLNAIQAKLTAVSGWQEPDHTFPGDQSNTNLFARLIRGEIPQWRVWENDGHLAFLTPFANRPAFTVVIPRNHLPSDILNLSQQDYMGLAHAIQKVATILRTGTGTSRVGLFFEGYEIDFAHAKVIPIPDNAAAIEGPSDEYHETYPGHITSRLGPRQDAEMLDASYKRVQECQKHNPVKYEDR